MIRLEIRLDGRGCLRGFKAQGHAEAGRAGEDLACAAASALLRTAARVLAEQEDLDCSAEAPAPGRLSLRLGAVPEGRITWLRGVTEFLLSGLEDIRQDHPGALDLHFLER